jgi:hypothetical protein
MPVWCRWPKHYFTAFSNQLMQTIVLFLQASAGPLQEPISDWIPVPDLSSLPRGSAFFGQIQRPDGLFFAGTFIVAAAAEEAHKSGDACSSSATAASSEEVPGVLLDAGESAIEAAAMFAQQKKS